MKNVKIILNEDVYNLGEEGDVREVAPGYARNYLIPKGLAVPYTRQYMALFEDRRTAIERRKSEKREAALGLKDRIESAKIVFEMPAGDSGKLFGSVTSAQIADRLMQEGLQIERKKIEIPGHTIKMAGEYGVTIKLYADEAATLSVVINPEGGSAKAEAPAKAKTDRQVEVAAAPEESDSEAGETEEEAESAEVMVAEDEFDDEAEEDAEESAED